MSQAVYLVPASPASRTAAGRSSTRPVDIRGALVDVGVRATVVAALVVGLVAFCGWAGRVVLSPGPWLAVDLAVYRALNGVSVPLLTGALFALLNGPSLDYFAVIVVLLGYCAWRRREHLPAAALAVGVALWLNGTVTGVIHHGGVRERPFNLAPEARTPIQSCGSLALVAMRTQEGPAASCGPADATGAGSAEAPPVLQGVDWREIWPQFPSFPSGHLRETAALCLLLVVFWTASWPFAVAYLVLLAFSRVHLGAHYPSDVLGGAAIGFWSGGVTVLGLDLLRRAAGALYRVPRIGQVWEWVFPSHATARPHLDPLPARLIRVTAALGVALVMVWALAFAAGNPRAGHIFSVLQDVDGTVYRSVSARFDVSVAPVLYGVLGPSGLPYVLATLATFVVAWRCGGRGAILPAGITMFAAVTLAFALHWAGTQWLQRPQPFTQSPDTPVPAEWRAAWVAASSFPNRHTLLVAALAGVLAPYHRASHGAAQALALGAAVTAVYFGAAWMTDALAAYLIGNLAARTARHTVAQILPDGAAGWAPAETRESRPALPEGTPAAPRGRIGRRAPQETAA